MIYTYVIPCSSPIYNNYIFRRQPIYYYRFASTKGKKKNRYNNLFFGIIFLSFTLHYINLIFIKKLLIIVIIIHYITCFLLYKFINIIFLYFSIVFCYYFPFFLCVSASINSASFSLFILSIFGDLILIASLMKFLILSAISFLFLAYISASLANC